MICAWKNLPCALLIFLCSMRLSLAVNDARNGRMLSGVYVYPGEPQCLSAGGICVKTNDCLELHPTKGLCPSYANEGVECCYRTPIRPAPCKDHLGACMSRCSPTIQRPATDCNAGQVCCVLVR